MTIDVRPKWVLFLAVGLLLLGGGSHLGGPGAAATMGQEGTGFVVQSRLG